jgi:hypothetical protein
VTVINLKEVTVVGGDLYPGMLSRDSSATVINPKRLLWQVETSIQGCFCDSNKSKEVTVAGGDLYPGMLLRQ